MNNSQIFEEKYLEIISQEEKSALKKFEDGVKKDIKFQYVSDKLLESFTSRIKDILNDKHIGKAHRFIESKSGKYDGMKPSKVQRVIDYELLAFIEEKKVENQQELIDKLASVYALDRMLINTVNNYDPYSYMYKLNDFSEFTYKSIEKEKPELTEKLRQRVYPVAKTKAKKRAKDYSKDIENTNRYLNTFSDNEKKVLLKAFYTYLERNYNNSLYKDFKDVMPTTEFAKIILIISQLEKPDVFYKNANSSSIPKNLSTGFTKPEIETLYNLEDRLKEKNLKKIKDYIVGLYKAG